MDVVRENNTAKFWIDPVQLAKAIGFSAHEIHTIQHLVVENEKRLRRHGMGILAETADERVKDIRFDEDSMSVDLMDGRMITVPLTWYPRLLEAKPEERSLWEPCAAGYGIHWPLLDEDLSTEGLLRGIPAVRIKKKPGSAA